jgi:protein-S-isoprenylcysteine O-methyltransferase Ste14
MTENQTDHANVKIEPIVLLLIHIFVLFLLRWLLPLSSGLPDVFEWLGYAFVVIGIGLIVRARTQFIRARTTRDPYASVTSIVTSGVYRFSRNPIYLGFVGLLLGFSFLFRTYWGLLLSPLFIVLMNTLVIQQEEVYLEKKFRDVYTGYKSRVRRWL